MKIFSILILLGAFSLPALACAQHEEHKMAENHDQMAKSKGEVIHIGVDGMVCDFCAQSLKKSFMKNPAVKNVDISLEKKLVTLELKSGEKMDDATIKKEVDYAGYKVSNIHHMPVEKE